MRILFLNQYLPPDPAPTGILLGELAEALAADGHVIEFVSGGENYRVRQGKPGRLGRELKALATMLWEGLLRRRVDLVISLSSPPCLLVVATLIAKRHRARSIHWIMDLYPEIAVALGEMSEGRGLGLLEKLMGWCYRSCAKVISLDADMAARLVRYGVISESIRPWVFGPLLAKTSSDASVAGPWTWIYSGNLGRSHEWETLLQAQGILEKQGADIRLLFQGGGPSWPAAQARAEELGLRNCEWKPYVPESQLRDSLLNAQCSVVSQLPAAQGLLWPSKLGFLLTLPRPILWVGPTEGAIARELKQIPHGGVFAPGEAGAIADWLRKLRTNPPIIGSCLAAATHRQELLNQWRQLVASLWANGSGAAAETPGAEGGPSAKFIARSS